MVFVEVQCANCNEVFPRSRNRAREARKRGWNHYCSKNCQNRAKITAEKVECSNPSCGTIFTRVQKELSKSKSGRHFCSKRCSVTVNNKIRVRTSSRSPSIPPQRICPICNKAFRGKRKYCEYKCRKQGWRKARTISISREQIIEDIKLFHKRHGRIPLKREFHHYSAARLRCGSWNKAIKAAGFTPNPAKFTTRRRAKDGHMCDSFAEKIIDDWLFENGIEHQRHIPYGKDGMTADFKVGDIFIEFIGLEGEHPKYDCALSRKRQFYKEKGLDVIELHPSDLFPEHTLDATLLPHLHAHAIH